MVTRNSATHYLLCILIWNHSEPYLGTKLQNGLDRKKSQENDMQQYPSWTECPKYLFSKQRNIIKDWSLFLTSFTRCVLSNATEMPITTRSFHDQIIFWHLLNQKNHSNCACVLWGGRGNVSISTSLYLQVTVLDARKIVE